MTIIIIIIIIISIIRISSFVSSLFLSTLQREYKKIVFLQNPRVWQKIKKKQKKNLDDLHNLIFFTQTNNKYIII